jgi:hypothetical protein
MANLKLIAVLLLFSTVKSFSQSKNDSIRALFKAMKQDSIMGVTSKSMANSIIMMQQQMNSKNHPEAKGPSPEIINYTIAKSAEMMKQFINEDMVEIYNKNFTQNEINDFILFYKSESGQKFISVSPKIQNEVMLVYVQKYMPVLKREMESKFQERRAIDKK